ncbi:DNA phosphorothioation-dependent restriction protein DptH [Bacillus hwajinpoensis]|uniref:DNA phosphorothioation-dependent restriction protein DptH n=1 Tax=Guptibacillus hwajinpoensis TaxID=208199 RepID=A0A845F0Z0_9BACL|nr:DNA phosphorothioation-dependent restriction protein DptH [Pseudalkalibacillus hwajinpoensis]MYL64375.1 DNA phosphorothioation-dependent restriction protein DptH [Pseudalkalibacillus hwajinpoensis]
MSNQFYNYISDQILQYFSSSSLSAGDRFYLQLDQDEEIQNLVKSLQQKQNVQKFIYKHEFGDPYETFCIEINSIRVVVAHTFGNIKPDFLVTLRNQVGEQQGVWKDTALLSIVSEQLDSIQGGSSDLLKAGMPLHPVSLNKTLKSDIEHSSLDKVDQIILLDNMDNLIEEQSFQQISFFDFQEIFTILGKGYMEDKDYKEFALFKDPDLATFTGKQLENRLEENRELFEFVRKVHDFGLDKEELEKKFTSEFANKLIQEDWEDNPYSDIKKDHMKYLETVKEAKLELKSLSVDKGVEIWDRPQRDTAAGKRKRHIILFNELQLEEINLQISFSLTGKITSLGKDFAKVSKKSYESTTDINVARSNMNVRIKPESNQPTFTKFTYKHDQKSTLGAEFSIVVLPVTPYLLEAFKTSYLVNVSSGDLEIQYEGSSLTVGQGINRELEIIEDHQIVELKNDEQLTLLPQADAFNDNNKLTLNLNFTESGLVLPLSLKNELPESTPITGARIWKLKRENQMNFELKSNRLVLGNRDFYVHSEYKEFIKWEEIWRDEGFRAAKVEGDVLQPISIDLGDDLREAYSRYLNYFNVKENIPTLSFMSPELEARAREYVNAYLIEVESFETGVEAGKKGRDLFNLGTISSKNEFYFTPYHPLMVAFQLQLNDSLSSEEIDNSVLSRLKPLGLVPYIYRNHDDLYKPDQQNAALEWMVYKPVSQVSVSDGNHYVAKVVEDKLTQFEEHFSYLFMGNSKAPLLVNLINVNNDNEILRGIIQRLTKQINSKDLEQVKPIEVTVYKSDATSAFDIFSRTESIEELETALDLKFTSKDFRVYEPKDLLQLIREKIKYYKREFGVDPYNYAHISFYKMQAQETYALQPMKDMVSGINLHGLYSSVPSMKGNENYRNGFGVKGYSIENNNPLTQTAYMLNELSANLKNGGNDSYHKGEAILSRTSTIDEDTLSQIFASSHWVTFVDPSVDLDFFNDHEDDLVVIHYSDQYSSSSRYDAITVTNKSDQYFAVVKEFLNEKEVEGSDKNVTNTIKAFNTFNGEWLLRIIGSKGHYSREKLSIISAIKFSLSYFDHRDILWVPISLEEILRVAGAAGLSKSEGVFTAKNLGVKGSHSDDLLLIGLNTADITDLKLHFYPVEVKIGANKNDVLTKAKDQVRKTKSLLNDALIDSEDAQFNKKFYRNFFVQLFLANVQKLEQNNIWSEKVYKLPDEIIEKLLKDQYSISNEIEEVVGEGAILSFQRDAYYRSSAIEEGITHVGLTEYDGYQGLVQSINQMHDWVQNKENDFVRENLLSYQYNPGEVETIKNEEKVLEKVYTGVSTEATESYGQQTASTPVETIDYPTEPESFETEDMVVDVHEEPTTVEENREGTSQGEVDSIEEEFVGDEVEVEPEEETKVTVTGASQVQPVFDIEKSRILLGKAENSNRQIYWEYGNKGLANRHLLISGKSGQGKTYFMQCLLLEKAKLGLSSVVIDYTEGFLPNQLEPEFVDYLGVKLKQKIVYNEKFPINPFKKNERDIGGIKIPESNTDIAERIKSVFSSVYGSLGIQQLNSLYEATLNGLEQFGEDMSLLHLRDMLEEAGTNYAKTTLSQIRPLIDRNPFTHENSLDWKDVLNDNGEVYVIQLTGYPRDVQLMITEFILWDLWNYTVRFGSKNNPLPVIMDEAQNLDHTEKSPSARILTEGRKFGWSAWYATQFLKSQLDTDELARLQNSGEKVYFSPPEQEISSIATSLSNDQHEKKQWEKKLSELKKGQCIVHGPIQTNGGELSKPVVTVVDIIPLQERM